ncbi:MAG: cobalt ECF transporter T component CbiQ [Phycisphaerae bacterium]|nr:cobalt ECF transporter T component CbiQ [Phycisphaerae bacterium]
MHRLDSRTKLLATIAFTMFVIALPPASVSMVICAAVWPVAILVAGRVPPGFVIRHILIVSPFVAVLAAWTAFYDRSMVHVVFGPFAFVTSGGALRCAGIIGRFVVTMAALIGLVATTRFTDLLAGMARLGLPGILVMQLGFLHRYIFLLIDRAEHMLRARAGRKLRNLGLRQELKTAAAMIGTLCLNSIEMAWRISTAMQARGFDGRLHTLKEMRLGRNDGVFAGATAIFLLGLYLLARGV